MVVAIRRTQLAILAANAQDIAEAKSAGAGPAFFDRLQLNASRVEAMAAGLDAIRKLKDPVGEVTASGVAPMECALSACACRSAWLA